MDRKTYSFFFFFFLSLKITLLYQSHFFFQLLISFSHILRYTQASPAASFMHNQEDLFHFFALDFTSNPNLALHSADLYLKAAFANEAIEKIISIYREYYKERGGNNFLL